MQRRIDIAKGIIENEEYLFDEVCPFCYHILQATTLDTGSKLYCPNEMCLNQEEYPAKAERRR